MVQGYDAFAALVYVTDVEESAVMRMYEWAKRQFEDDDQLYYQTEINGKKIVAARQDEMGMTASATLTMKIIEHFRPKYVIMPGIAAGTLDESKNEQIYGDVVIANMVWNYSNGKYVPKEEASIVFGEIGFQPRPTVVAIDRDLIPSFDKAIHSVMKIE